MPNPKNVRFASGSAMEVEPVIQPKTKSRVQNSQKTELAIMIVDLKRIVDQFGKDHTTTLSKK